jgi:sulfate permease, SulP family
MALGLIVGLLRTPLRNVATLVGLVVPTVIVALWEPAGVRLVSDVGEIPRGLPPLGLPDFKLFTPELLASAFALAVVIAIQGAGISQSYRNPDGSEADPSRDMFAQGAANALGSLVSGMPTGGSVGQTALNVSEQARGLDLDEEVALFPATGILGDSTGNAVAAANGFLRQHREDGSDTMRWPV